MRTKVALFSLLLAWLALLPCAHAQTPQGPLDSATSRGAERAAREARLHSIEDELAAIRPEMVRIRQAKIMTAVGFGAAGAFTVLGAIVYVVAYGMLDWCVDNCDSPPRGPSMRRIYQYMLAPIAISLTVGSTGAALVHRRKVRAGPRIPRYRALELERRALILDLRKG